MEASSSSATCKGNDDQSLFQLIMILFGLVNNLFQLQAVLINSNFRTFLNFLTEFTAVHIVLITFVGQLLYVILLVQNGNTFIMVWLGLA